MRLFLNRTNNTEKYCEGKLYINGNFFSDTLEDPDRNLFFGTSKEHIQEVKDKYPEAVAIPRGTYEIDMDTVSPRFDKKKYYHETFGGKLPRLKDVPGFVGVLIHPLNKADESEGCLGVGVKTENGKIGQSRATFERLYEVLRGAADKGETIKICIQ